MTEWRAINDFPGYEVSEHGDVRRGDAIKKQMHDRKGYGWVGLWIDGKSHTRYVARLVARAFIGPRPDGQQVRHKNGMNTDDHFSNLEYGTRAENEHDKRRHGTAPIGENHPAAKLTQNQVMDIRARYVKNSRAHGCTAIGLEYGVSRDAAYRAAVGNTWKHLP